MVRNALPHRIERLRAAVVSMADLVRERLESAHSVLFTCDRALARAVIEGDRELNRRYLAIERECLDLLALYQPVASDLRTVVAAFEIVTDLERVGDLATNLAGYALDSNDCLVPDVDLERVGALAGEMVEDAIDAYRAGDSDACVAVADRDDELDERCRAVSERILRRLLELTREDGRDEVIADATWTLLLVRDLERIGDHAVDVAARTLYAIDADESLLA